ncbi:MAG TPA: hypothetical protein PKZ42_05245 [Syntrophales bacterium]|nr:hypothetical protein [Syntrophales bacterium]
MKQLHETLCEIYTKLDAHFGDLKWWPGETQFEIAVGAILTQNTNWKNVEIAINALMKADLLEPEKLYRAGEKAVAGLIRSSGYYNIKAKRLKSFLDFLYGEYDGDLEEMFDENLGILRRKLLGVKGIGEETADSILLYAGGKPIFVVDAYTRRILERHSIIKSGKKYKEIQSLFMENLPHDTRLFNQYHALFVNTGKHFCRKKPLCSSCPLENAIALNINNNIDNS